MKTSIQSPVSQPKYNLHTIANIGAANVYYASPVGGDTTENMLKRYYFTRAWTLKNLRAVSTNTIAGGSTDVYTVRKNGADTAITCTHNSGTTANDTTHTASVVAGDYITFKCEGTGAGTVGGVCALVLECEGA